MFALCLRFLTFVLFCGFCSGLLRLIYFVSDLLARCLAGLVLTMFCVGCLLGVSDWLLIVLVVSGFDCLMNVWVAGVGCSFAVLG